MKNKKLVVLSLLGVLALTSCGNDTSSGSGGGSSQTPSSGTPVQKEDLANGFRNFSWYDYEDKQEILYQLEKYTIDNFLGGIPMYDNGSNILYSSRLTIPSDVYVPNYGFGVSEGTITTPMTAEQEPIEKYRMYYHSWQSIDPGIINYWDGQDSVSSDLWGLMTSSYYSTEFSDDKQSYQWYNSLAKEEPIALNADDHGMATQWRVKVKTVEDDPNLVYHTLSTKPEVAAFNDRGVVLEDYLTPFKAMIDNNLFRATDLGGEDSGFIGVEDYLEEDVDKRDWSTVGIQLNEEEQAIDFTFNAKKTAFYAMYSLASSLYSPLPQDFLDLLQTTTTEEKDGEDVEVTVSGARAYGMRELGVDGVLSLGMYTLEEWEDSKIITFKKNPTYFEKDRANFAGYHYAILKDQNVAYDEFKAGKLDSAGVPSVRLQEEISNPQRRQTLGDTVWKLQVNATTEERWLELFGPEGTIYPHAKEDTFWNVKPVMSNHNFLNGLYYSVNRIELADSQGKNPAQAFLSDAYMIDPENGLGWRDTEKGESVVADRSPETQGFSEELAKAYFQAAMSELEEAGEYTPGTADNPVVISLRLIYQSQTQVDTEGKNIEKYFEETFNSAVQGYKLNIIPYATADWMDAYNMPMFGEFDLAFGSISGNTLDPISFMNTVISDNRTGFTLSWGPDTSAVHLDDKDRNVTFEGEIYSFDALWTAAATGGVIQDGEVATNFTFESAEANDTLDANGKATVTATGTYFSTAPEIELKLDYVEFWYYPGTVKDEEGAQAYLDDPEAWFYAGNGGVITSEIREGENDAGYSLEFTLDPEAGTWEIVVSGLKPSEDGWYEIDYYFILLVEGTPNSVAGYSEFQGPKA